jgi:pimeloyl-CoA synthetase
MHRRYQTPNHVQLGNHFQEQNDNIGFAENVLKKQESTTFWEKMMEESNGTFVFLSIKTDKEKENILYE